MQRIIGIDFGTSTTYMNIKRYNGNQPVEDRFSYIPVVFNYGGSSGMVASIVRENADGTYDFGEKAEEQLQDASIYKEIKMLLESPDAAQRSQARRITEEFFKFLYETYAQQAANLGSKDDTEETIVSYPVKWQPETVAFMLDAARKAGFQNVRGMDEATAAVLAMLCQNANSKIISAGKPGYLMLVDMGAGTTDLVVCKYQADENGDIHVELVANWPRTAGEPAFGGREIDRILEKYVEDYLSNALTPAMAANAHVIATMPGQAKMWKEKNVSVNLCANKPVNTCAYLGTYKMMGILNDEFPAFGRPEFEQIAQSGIKDYVNLLLGCLTDAAEKDPQFASDGLDLVILTGGHSAWYFVHEILDGTMDGYLEHPALARIRGQKDRVVRLPNPQTTVSLGLVYSRLPFRLSKTESRTTGRQETGEQAGEKTSPPPRPDNGGSDRQPADEQYAWDYRLLPVIREFLQETPAFAQKNRMECSSLTETMRKTFEIAPMQEILYLESWLSPEEKPEPLGIVMTDVGIYVKSSPGRDSIRFMSWWEFMNGGLKYGEDPQSKEKNVAVCGGGVMMTFEGEQAGDIGVLHARLRREAVTVQKAGGTPQPRKTDGGPYKWDTRLVKPLTQYMKERGGEISIHLRNSDSPELRKRLKVPATAAVFLAHDDSVLKSGGCGFAVTNIGIYFKDRILEPSPRISWEQFLNGSIRFTDSEYCNKLCLETPSGTVNFAVMILLDNEANGKDTQMKIKAFFQNLQTFLRQQATVLKETGTLPPEDPDTLADPEQSQTTFGKKDAGTTSPQPKKPHATVSGPGKPYDPSKCPKCGSPIPAGAKKCPMCGRAKLRELTTPFKLGLIAWYHGEKQLGIAKATGSLTIFDDRIEYKKNLGNTAEMLIPYWNIYKTIKANTDPREIFWLRDIAGVKESTYGLGVPSIVLTMKDGNVHTFVTGTASQSNKDNISCAAALIARLMQKSPLAHQ